MTDTPAVVAAPLASSAGRAAATGNKDILRKERFGALYYSRRTCQFHAVPIRLARLLVGATRDSALEVYAREPEACGLSEPQLLAQLLRWKRDGVLDDDYRCSARIVDGKRTHGAVSAPLITHLQLTRACNTTCRHCFVDIRPKPAPGEMSTAEITALFAELDAIGSPVVLLAGGEPITRPDLDEIVAGVRQHALDAWLCTNATLIDERVARLLADSALRGVSVSLDGPDTATHDAMRGSGHFERTVRGVRRLIDAGAPEVHLRLTATALNAPKLVGLGELAHELGVHKVIVKPFRRAGAAMDARDLDLNRPDYVRAVTALRASWPINACALEIGDGVPRRLPEWTGTMATFGCVGGQTAVTVTDDGRIAGCGFAVPADAWSLREHSFAECWQRAPSVALWRSLAASPATLGSEAQMACGGGCRVRAVGAGAGGSMGDPDPWLEA
ncbi:MAG: radical SAM protein [Myxococcota bacterium]